VGKYTLYPSVVLASRDKIDFVQLAFNEKKKNRNSVIIYSPSWHSKPEWLSFFSRAQKKRYFWRTLEIK